MKLALKTGILAALLLVIGGCVYDPGYGYVRGDRYHGSVYYGASYYDGSPYYPYYGYRYDYSPGYYGYGPVFGLGFRYDNYHHRYRSHGSGPRGHGHHR